MLIGDSGLAILSAVIAAAAAAVAVWRSVVARQQAQEARKSRELSAVISLFNAHLGRCRNTTPPSSPCNRCDKAYATKGSLSADVSRYHSFVPRVCGKEGCPETEQVVFECRSTG